MKNVLITCNSKLIWLNTCGEKGVGGYLYAHCRGSGQKYNQFNKCLSGLFIIFMILKNKKKKKVNSTLTWLNRTHLTNNIFIFIDMSFIHQNILSFYNVSFKITPKILVFKKVDIYTTSTTVSRCMMIS